MLTSSNTSGKTVSQPLSLASSEVAGLCLDWREQLRGAIEHLRNLEVSTEKEFLAIGGSLQEYSLRTQKASAHAQTIAGHLSLENLKKVEDELHQVLERLRLYLEGTDRDGLVKEGNLKDISEQACLLLRPLSELDRSRRILRMMGLYVRIENARLGRADGSFEAVADVAERLADTIKERIVAITQHMTDLQTTAEALRSQLSQVSQDSGQRRTSIFAASRECLTSLEKSNVLAEEKCGRFAKGISQRSGDIARGITGVVMSMQFHDITRQQVEHVRHSLSEMEQRLPQSPSQGVADAALREVVESAATLTELHLAQVTQARDTMVKAVQDINEHLGTVRSNLGAILEDTDHLAGNSREVTSALAEDLRRMIDPLGDFFQTQSRIAQDMGGALGKVNTILGGVTLDIEAIGAEIKMIAVNSLVKTSRMGAEGMALRVLAESIQKLSDEVCDRTALVGKPLDEISARAVAIEIAVTHESAAGESELADMNNLLQRHQKQFSMVASEVVELSGEVRMSLGTLVTDIDRASASFQIEAMLREEFGEVISRVEAVRRRARMIAPWATVDTVGEAVAAKLKAESARYTMDSEREVHERVFGMGAPVQSPTSTSVPDDFEFFGSPSGPGLFDGQATTTPSSEADVGGIELFDAPAKESESEPPKKKEDFGENIELF